MNQAMVASPSLANFQFTTGRHSFSFLSKKSVQHTDSSRWPRGRERHRVGDYKERTMTRDEIATNASSKSRNLANFESTVWGYHFHSYTSELTEISTQEKFELEELKEKVRKMLVETPDNSAQKLVLIDTIQRLGVAYHFYNEIETSIQNIFNASQVLQSENNFDDNLYVVALRFRLVRQQGHYMSSDVFKQFTGHGGKFKETHDVLGLLSLYEAAHMRVHEEEILEEALTFTTTRLESILPNLSNSLKVEVNEALNQPIRKTVPRVGARKYICIYENSKSHNDLLLKFAKLDFNMLQKLHQQELNELTSWWKDLDIANKLPYAKDRFVEGYFWITGMSFEPQYSRVRRMLTKLVSVNTLIDDTYDAYGTFDELVIFTNAIQRWDIRAMDSLPPFMRTIYQALLNIYDEAEEVLAKEGKSDSVIYYAKNEMKKIVTAYMKETDWLNAGYIPKCEEYMTIALVTSGCMLYVTNSLVGIMEELMTKETIEWMTNGPLIICAASAICRLMNDIADHEVDQQRGHVASFVECYIKEYKALKEEAYIEIQKKIVNAWKEINKEFLCPKIPIFVLERALSYARLTDTLYKGGHDGYVNPKFKTKNLITLLLVQSVNI